jgi:hypothetical protein
MTGPRPRRPKKGRRKSPEPAGPQDAISKQQAPAADPPPPASFRESGSDAEEAALHHFAPLPPPPLTEEQRARFQVKAKPEPGEAEPPKGQLKKRSLRGPKDRARVHVVKPCETHEDRYRTTGDFRHAALAVGEAMVREEQVPTWAIDACLRYTATRGASEMEVKAECRRRYENHLRVLNRFDDPSKRRVKHQDRDAPRLARMEALIAGETGKCLKPGTAARRVAREDAKNGEDEKSIVRELLTPA